MMVTMELWQLVTLLLAFFGCVASFGKILLHQFEKRQGERFDAQDESRKEAQAHWDQRFSAIEKSSGEWSRIEKDCSRIEKDFLRWQGDLPFRYVLRDDYVRNQTVIEAKMDAIATRLENLKLRGVVQ
jgi:hypothetical protein